MAKVKEQVLIDYNQGTGTVDREEEVPVKGGADKEPGAADPDCIDIGTHVPCQNDMERNSYQILADSPIGTDKDEPIKYDDGKVDLELFFECFPNAFEAVAKVLMYGAKKYGRRGVAFDIKNARARYSSSMLRHKLARAKGEVINKESNCPHLWHETFNSLAVLEESLTKK